MPDRLLAASGSTQTSFALHGPLVQLSGRVAKSDSFSCYQSAVSGDEMVRGVHCAQFTCFREGGAHVGVVGPGFDPSAGAPAHESADGWTMHMNSGRLCHAGANAHWEGQPIALELTDLDVVMLVLDLDAGTLTVWVNDKLRGLLVGPDSAMPSGRDGGAEPVAPLQGPLRWAVDVWGASVQIDGPHPPPTQSAADAAKEAKQRRARKARREALERKWTFVSKPTPTTRRPVEGSDSDEFSDDEGGAAAGAEPPPTRLPFRPADG